MKLESDPVSGVQTPARKSYNPFDSDDEIEPTNDYLKNNLNGYDIKSFETNDDSLTFHLDSSELSWEEAILSHSQILSRTTPADSNGEEVLFRKDTELFTDKTVTDSELPEMMGYSKETSYQSVKDIGIDEGMRVYDKVSVKSRDNHGSKNVSSLLDLNGQINGDGHLDLPYMEGLKSRVDSRNSENDVSCQDRSLDALKESGLDNGALKMQHISDQSKIEDSVKVNGFEHDLSTKQSTISKEKPEVLVDSGSVVFGATGPQSSKADEVNYPKLDKEKNQVSKEEHDQDKRSMVNTHESSTQPSIANGEAAEESRESRNEEATTSQSAEPTQDLSDNGVNNTLSYNSKVESGSIILDFNSSNVEGKVEEENDHKEKEKEKEVVEEEEKEEEKKEEEKKEEENTEKTVAKPPEAQSMHRHDEEPSASIFNSGSDNRVHGETSFSAATAPASITFMGHNSHIGNISLRSESSAGSTRSFAFPVLQAEWNSSPVRMAKADQRNFRKQRGWVHSIMCCRF